MILYNVRNAWNIWNEWNVCYDFDVSNDHCTRHLIPTEHRITNHVNTMINTDTGQSLEYSHLTRGPNKEI